MAVDSSGFRSLVTASWRLHLGKAGLEPGTSLLQRSIGFKRLTRFLEEVEQATGVAVPPTALMRLGTAEALSDAMEGSSWPAASPLVLLKAGLDDADLYVVAAGSGVVLELCDLAARIEFPGRIWGLQLPGLDGETPPLTSISAIAAHHARAILAQGPVGRCNVVGYSFGGLVAVELARLMGEAGRQVGLVGLIDTTCYEHFWPKAEWLRVTAHRCRRRLRETRSLGGREAWRHVTGRMAAAFGHMRRRLVGSAAAHRPEHSIYFIGGLDPRFQSVRNASIAAWESFRPRAFDKPVVLFKSALGDPHACDPAAIWRKLVARLEVVVVSGTHATILRKPLVQRLAQAISVRLDAGPDPQRS